MTDDNTKHMFEKHDRLTQALLAVLDQHTERNENGIPTPDSFALTMGVIGSLAIDWAQKNNYPKEQMEKFIQFHLMGVRALWEGRKNDEQRRRMHAH